MPYHRLGVSKCDRLGRECGLEEIDPQVAETTVQGWVAQLRALGVDVVGG